MKIVAMSHNSAIFHVEIYSSMVVILFQGDLAALRPTGDRIRDRLLRNLTEDRGRAPSTARG